MDSPSRVLKHLMVEYDHDKRWLAEQTDVSLQGIRNMLVRDSYTIRKYEELLKLFDAELVVMTKEGKIFR